MSEKSDLMKLYSTRILALAADIPHVGRLENPDGSAMCRSPLCGSKVTVDLNVNDGKVSAFAQDVKACALGQAAASVVGAQILGRNLAQLKTAQTQLDAMLKSGGAVPETPFDGLEVLAPAADFKNRHASILLALDATIAAFENAKSP